MIEDTINEVEVAAAVRARAAAVGGASTSDAGASTADAGARAPVIVPLRRVTSMDITSTRLYPTALAGCYVETAAHWDKDACLAMIAVGTQVSSADWNADAHPSEQDTVRGHFIMFHLVNGGPLHIAMVPGTVIIYASGQVCHGKKRAPGADAPQINSTLYVRCCACTRTPVFLVLIFCVASLLFFYRFSSVS